MVSLLIPAGATPRGCHIATVDANFYEIHTDCICCASTGHILGGEVCDTTLLTLKGILICFWCGLR